MGQEISLTQFETVDFERFHCRLEQETRLLKRLIEQDACSRREPVAGFEIEAWLVDSSMRPAPINKEYLATLSDPMATVELARFNVELNSDPVPLSGNVFDLLHRQLQATWDKARRHAESLQHHIVMIGILPTLKQSDLTLANMSDMHRYRALNEQILQARGRPVHIDISGCEHLKFDHLDVMLESATTSFQTHIQLPVATAHHYYNASILASAPMVALCANSPYLFGRELWHETRIPLFEQAIETGGFDGVAQGPLHRVSFGSGFARHSIMECFEENLDHFPILLPVDQQLAIETMAHLRLHNGTIWRWNRPLVGFDSDGTPHIRIEHRTPAAGPTVIDAIANAAFYYGLSRHISDEIIDKGLPLTFSAAKDNFYQAARYGLDGVVTWFDGSRHRLDQLFRTELIARAATGLRSFGIDDGQINDFLDVIRQRVASKQNGSAWQRRFIRDCSQDFSAMTRAYLDHQNAGQAVGEWAES